MTFVFWAFILPVTVLYVRQWWVHHKTEREIRRTIEELTDEK